MASDNACSLGGGAATKYNLKITQDRQIIIRQNISTTAIMFYNYVALAYIYDVAF
jgi:hypothetical protein